MASSSPILILGIDPGLQHTGWGIIRAQGSRVSYVSCGSIHPPAKAPLAERLHTLHQQLQEIIQRYQPDIAAIEQTFVSSNAASTLKLGNARGALLLSLAIAGLPVHEYDATLVKKTITGAGRAEKAQIMAMVKLLLPACDAHASADAYDALAIALTHSQHQRIVL